TVVLQQKPPVEVDGTGHVTAAGAAHVDTAVFFGTAYVEDLYVVIFQMSVNPVVIGDESVLPLHLELPRLRRREWAGFQIEAVVQPGIETAIELGHGVVTNG